MYELLSPAGNFEKLQAALLYGADAVYLAGNRFGMRSAADNFTQEELYSAADYVHRRGKKLYLAVNTMPHGHEYPALKAYLQQMAEAQMDAFIVADLGVLALLKEVIPHAEVHISTQASIVSPAAAQAYAALGAKRLVLARELSLEEIRNIRRALPEQVELEAFVHGSMCVSYSGRCLLSNCLTGRDANRGACAQPCRWNYSLVEETRPNASFPIEQNDKGTFIMSSKDLCTLPILDRLMEAGIHSFKIEGRMKSAYYTAVITNAYRMAMDAYLRDPKGYVFDPAWLREAESVSHREYDTGFYLDSPLENAQVTSQTGYIREKAYFATAVEWDPSQLPASLKYETEGGKLCKFIQRNKVCRGEAAEMISPRQTGLPFRISELYSETGEPIESTPHPAMLFYARIPFPVREGDIMRSGEN
ncbi:MAG: U32 family peptidase [Clostridia bacterium]|nr:U32 family peptidase [Clostridia bacterium]